MANLMLTARCVRSCAFCFAQRAMASQPAEASLDDVERFSEWVAHAGIGQLRLVGGEPTLHSRLGEVLMLGRRQGLELLIFTSGLVPPHALEALVDEPERVVLVMNCLPPEQRRSRELAHQLRTVHAMPDRVMPGFTISGLPWSFDFLLELLEHHPFRRRLRLGLGLPALGATNRALHPRQYLEVGRRVGELAEQAAALGVELELDCGFVRCMFDDRSMAALERNGTRFGFGCSPTLDVLPDGSVIHCFALASISRLPWDSSLPPDNYRDRFTEMLAPWRLAGIFPECSSCDLRRDGTCAGGCLARTIQRFRPATGRIEERTPGLAGQPVR